MRMIAMVLGVTIMLVRDPPLVLGQIANRTPPEMAGDWLVRLPRPGSDAIVISLRLHAQPGTEPRGPRGLQPIAWGTFRVDSLGWLRRPAVDSIATVAVDSVGRLIIGINTRGGCDDCDDMLLIGEFARDTIRGIWLRGGMIGRPVQVPFVMWRR